MNRLVGPSGEVKPESLSQSYSSGQKYNNPAVK